MNSNLRAKHVDWDTMYKAAVTYYNMYGHIDIPDYYIDNDNLKLGRWIQSMRIAYKKHDKVLTEERIEKLNSLGMIWSKTPSWDSYYYMALEFYRKSGNLDISVSYITENGYRLGRWVYNVKKYYNELSEEQKSKLKLIGIKIV